MHFIISTKTLARYTQSNIIKYVRTIQNIYYMSEGIKLNKYLLKGSGGQFKYCQGNITEASPGSWTSCAPPSSLRPESGARSWRSSWTCARRSRPRPCRSASGCRGPRSQPRRRPCCRCRNAGKTMAVLRNNFYFKHLTLSLYCLPTMSFSATWARVILWLESFVSVDITNLDTRSSWQWHNDHDPAH